MKTIKTKLKKLTKIQYKTLKDFSHYTNNLYNYAMYIVQQYYKETNEYIGTQKLYKEVKNNENFKLLPAQVAMMTIKLLDKDYRSFFSLLKRKQGATYKEKINTPKFKKRGDQFIIPYGFQLCSIKNNTLTFCVSNEYKKLHPEVTTLKIPFTYPINGTIKQIIIKPVKSFQYFNIYIDYEENIQTPQLLDSSKHLSIDLGLNNLATCFANSGHSFIVNGKPLKSFNRWHNKEKAKTQSELKLKNNFHWSKKLTWLEERRKWFIDNYFNQTVAYITKYCLENNIGNIICGYNESWKIGINLGPKNNQAFVNIPHFLFKRKLESKCKSFGINFVLQEESYTSKASFLDGDSFSSKTFSGKRIKRGLYKSSNGTLINADVNGAANILRKVIGDVACNQSIVALALKPLKVNLL